MTPPPLLLSLSNFSVELLFACSPELVLVLVLPWTIKEVRGVWLLSRLIRYEDNTSTVTSTSPRLNFELLGTSRAVGSSRAPPLTD